jgi:preprotein translocase subunit SecG
METPKNLLNNQQEKQAPKQINLGNAWNTPKLPTPAPKKFWTSMIFIVAIALVVVLVILYVASNKKQKAPVENVTQTESTEVSNKGNLENSALSVSKRVVAEPVSVSGSNDIAANDQKAGDKVEVTMVTLSVPGWVAIQEDKDGGLGNVLGASRFDPGIHLGEIELLRGTVSGGVYHAVLYQDNGDKQFDMSTDAPIKNPEGKIIEAKFKAE